jgi:hypothetical protein
MKINRKKLPIKYALEVFPNTTSYPSQQDLEYVTLWILQEKNMLEKPFTAENLWSGMKNHLGTMEDLRFFLTSIANPINHKDVSIILEQVSAGTYRLKSHVWM